MRYRNNKKVMYKFDKKIKKKSRESGKKSKKERKKHRQEIARKTITRLKGKKMKKI